VISIKIQLDPQEVAPLERPEILRKQSSERVAPPDHIAKRASKPDHIARRSSDPGRVEPL
jgi:hypothetical protein